MTQEEIKNHPGQTIWKQIGLMTKMSCGAREARLIEDGICFKVGGKPMRYIDVALDLASDTYTVHYYRLKRTDYSRVTLDVATGIYAEMLNEILYNAVNGAVNQ